MMARRALVVLMALVASVAQGQCEMEPRPSKAQKLYSKATSPKGKASLQERIAMLDEGLEIHPEDPEALLACAELQFKATRQNPGMWESMAGHLAALQEVCPGGMPEALYLRGAMAYVNDDVEGAITQFGAYLAAPEEATTPSRRSEVEALREELTFLRAYRAHAGLPAPEPIPELSWDEDEYLPVMSPDGTLMFFTRAGMQKDKGEYTSTRKERFTWARRNDERQPFDGGTPLGYPFNVRSNYGGAAISVDNKTLILAAHHPVPANPNNIDLFVTEYHIEERTDDGTPTYSWSELIPLCPGVNTDRGWEAQPSLSSDGATLLFAGARAESAPDANGNPTMDLYMAQRTPTGCWGTPERLPAPVNSPSQDKAPFLHPDGRTLYFASNRKPSGGGFDLWMTQRDTSGVWSEPVNMGLPLNSSGDEHGLVVSTDGQTAVFSTRRRGTRGIDLCAFNLPESLQPDDVAIVKGEVGWPLPDGDFTVSIEYVQSKTVEQIEVSTEDGRFAHVVRTGDQEDVIMTIQGESTGYQSVVVHDKEAATSSAVTIDLTPDEDALESEAFELEDVQFATKQSDLNSRCQVILRGLANHMLRNPDLRLDIAGHTDDVGDEKENLALSIRRAEVVSEFLSACGVEESRMSSQGFGESRPKTANLDEAGRRVNRRTEFRWMD